MLKVVKGEQVILKGKLTIENARLIFKNFSGKEGKYNREGDRNFCVVLDDVDAAQMMADGWNVKWTKPNEEYDSIPYISVKVSFKKFKPTIVLIAETDGETIGKRTLDEDELNILDYTHILKADIIISPYNYDVGGKTGVTAYLSSLYATFEVDPLELKYKDIPDTAMSSFEIDED